MICSLVGFVLVGKLFEMSRSGRWTVPTSSVSPDGARRPPGPRSERFSLPEDRARCAAAITRSGGCHYQGARSTERNGTVTPITIFITPWSPPIIIGDLVSHRSCGKIFVLSQLFGERRWRMRTGGGGWDRERPEAGLFSMQLILISFETSNLMSFQNQSDLKFQFSPILFS